MTFAEFESIVQPFGFTVRKMYSNWLSTNNPDTTKAYMASVTMDKSEFPTWIDGICISAEFILDKMLCFTVHPTIQCSDINEFYFAGEGKIITNMDLVTKEFIENYLIQITTCYNNLKMNLLEKDISNDFV